jgi:uncharacterized FAD-dependent dehydrogenase
MSLRVGNLRLSIDQDEQSLPAAAARALGILPSDILHWRILRKSLDARAKREIVFVYAIEVTLPEKWNPVAPQRASQRGVEIAPYDEEPFTLPTPGTEPLDHPPIIIGAGPAGLFTAYFLAEQGYAPIVLERGEPVSKRIEDVQAFDAGGPHNPESNYLFGEGGAGTFSDGKLTCRASGPDVRKVLQILADSKGKPSIVYDHRPHLGSNRLPAVVKALRQKIESLGGVFRFGCRVDDIQTSDERMSGLVTNSGHLPAEVVVLATGHSARDTYEMLHRHGVAMEQKPFQFGVRIEQPQEQVNRFQYGSAPLEDTLGAADYRVIAHGPHDLFSFCMCAGGYIMPSVSESGYFCTNGMSLSKRNSPFANSGMMITIEPRDFGSPHVLAGMELQRGFERLAFEAGNGEYRCPIQRAGDFLQSRKTSGHVESSYPRETVSVDLAGLVPKAVSLALRHGLPTIDARWKNLFLRNGTLVGPEARGSAPVRFPRHEATLESVNLPGLYPIGEGAGYAGGIVSAALDGLRAAKAIIRRYASVGPPSR